MFMFCKSNNTFLILHHFYVWLKCHFVHFHAKIDFISIRSTNKQLASRQGLTMERQLTFAEASHAPDTKLLASGDRLRLITSPVWPLNDVVCCPVSMSHSALQFTATITTPSSSLLRLSTPQTSNIKLHTTAVWEIAAAWQHRLSLLPESQSQATDAVSI